MNKKEFEFILSEGEGYKIEFKESLKNIDKEIVAFANADGGRIFLGVSDDSKVKGVKIDNRLKSQVQDIANNCDPKVKIRFEYLNDILIITVIEGADKPYKCSSGFYLRQGPNSQKMKTKDIKDMVFSQGNVKFDESVNKDFDLKDFDEGAFNDYLRRAGIENIVDRDTILFNLSLTGDNKSLNNAGILLFSKRPKKYFINADVTCVRYLGIDKVNVLDRIDIESNIVSQVEESIKFILRNTRTGYEIKGIERKNVPEYPTEALREAIVNAIIHRDYSEKGANVQIDIFDDRIQISNVGSLIPPLDKESLGKIAVRRNPLLADLFHRINLVEKIGSGIRRIKEECRKHGNVMFRIETNGFFISVFKKKVGEKDLERDLERDLGRDLEREFKLSDSQKKIIYAIRDNKDITQEELSKLVGINEKNIRNNIAKLKQKGILERVGPDKGGYWKLLR